MPANQELPFDPMGEPGKVFVVAVLDPGHNLRAESYLLSPEAALAEARKQNESTGRGVVVWSWRFETRLRIKEKKSGGPSCTFLEIGVQEGSQRLEAALPHGWATWG